MGDSLKQMILYGSYARGDYGDNSDMDIMVLTELTDDRIIQIEDEIFDAAYDIELEYGVPISVNIKNEMARRCRPNHRLRLQLKSQEQFA